MMCQTLHEMQRDSHSWKGLPSHSREKNTIAMQRALRFWCRTRFVCAAHVCPGGCAWQTPHFTTCLLSSPACCYRWDTCFGARWTHCIGKLETCWIRLLLNTKLLHPRESPWGTLIPWRETFHLVVRFALRSFLVQPNVSLSREQGGGLHGPEYLRTIPINLHPNTSCTPFLPVDRNVQVGPCLFCLKDFLSCFFTCGSAHDRFTQLAFIWTCHHFAFFFFSL